ncbi:Membrane-bound lytic murein transglycosylase A [Xenorhabdus poinarii G6]|uniref:Membrane-bound lytic murein transglycosylase A n=1 Tax=Xenorhabdus poinarii G6 TaxID=1354304 RepID=A0A068R1F0_9GAMM|nr:murein transglycosylase A [Xenorhabdus poinarii]CDG19930.1 Membrane-bound lytic murein transglycosylase A [Xenorhabdus poinarii G6]
MKVRGKYLLFGIIISLLSGCHSRPTDQAQQYKDGHITHDFQLVNTPNAEGSPVNASDFVTQVNYISETSPRLYANNREIFEAVKRWMRSGGDTRDLNEFGLLAYQMEGSDNYGNVKFTGYYTPVLNARYTKQGEFKYPLYRMPTSSGFRLPTRAAIYRGALNKKFIIGYSNSLIDNFMMEVQGSGYVNFGDGRPLTFFGYGGKNGHAYRSIGKVLIDRDEVPKDKMSMRAIRQWAEQHSEAEVKALLEQNPSFVFFKPEPFTLVRGASAVPLVAKASVASDKSLIPPGTALLAEVPVLDEMGKFTGQYQMRLMVALDVGGAIKGNHFDIYHGVGKEPGEMAGFYNHYGRVWVLKKASAGFLAANQ